MDTFWEKINNQLIAATQAHTVNQLMHAVVKTGEGAFFAGSGGDVQLVEVLPEGWEIHFIEGDYHWAARDVEGRWVTYTEGDLTPGLTQEAAETIYSTTGV